jgi:sugar/nucleoside kinase (ribokinase family)
MARTETLDVVAVGNAIVDVVARAEDRLLRRHGLTKGTMRLVDEAAARHLYDAMGPGIEISGGSAANTVAGVASLGGRAAFIGKVRDDQLGQVFRHDIQAAGVAFATAPASDGAATARCLIMVTPDAQRTMSTYLGACVGLGPADIDAQVIGSAQVTYLEGYLWDPPQAKAAFRLAMKVASEKGRQVALTLSDPFCVDRWRDEFRDLVDNHVDILFANETEIIALYRAKDFAEALNAVRGKTAFAALTRSEKGSVVLAGDDTYVIAAEPDVQLVDTTGAGDLYAAGFLHGLTQGRDPATCGRIGSLCAAEAISHFGARPETALAELVRRRNL